MTLDAMKVSVRFEVAGDEAAVRAVNEEAFGGVVEAGIVDALRGSADSISLVAIANREVVGHILFTPVTIERAPALRVAGLAPMAVLPLFQRRGVGGALIRAGLEECRRSRYAAVVVVGHPEYYPKFGFTPADTWGVEYADPIPREVFMALELERGALSGCAGVVRFRPEFAEP
jgi:putative acetyltransferase